MTWQDLTAFSVVTLAAGIFVWGFFRKTLAGPLSRWLLSKGKVKTAMKLRALSNRKSPHSDCH